MKVSTLFSYLAGRREAILEIAGDPKAVRIGMLLVLSAAFAREYDAEYLPAKPWLLALPWAMSLVASFLVFAVFRLAARKRVPRPPYWRSYRSFLALFWMTAPLAWLYAVPYERFLTPYGATVANLWSLAVVAAWRVLLITQAASVLFGFGRIRSFFLVMLPADVMAVAAAVLSPKPIIDIMGGLSHSPEDALLSSVTLSVILLGVYSFPVWLAGAVLAVVFAQVRGAAWATLAAGRTSRSAWALAWATVLIWILVLPFTQSEQRRAAKANGLLEEGRIPEALDFLSAYPRERFPPLFDPRPRLWEGETTPDLLDVMEALVERPTAPWVSEAYVRKVLLQRDERLWLGEYRGRLARLLPKLPDGPRIAAGLGYADPDVGVEHDEDFMVLHELAKSAEGGDVPN